MNDEKPKIDIDDIKKRITDTWFWYKVCEGCENVALFSDNFCPKCRGYRFDENRRRVINQVVRKYEEKIKRESTN